MPNHDRPIVYSARYYFPPGDSRTSHFHLYRAEPDGGRRLQVTTGDSDDRAPAWSPDGTKIAFVREHGDGGPALCVVGADGGRVRTLYPSAPFRLFRTAWADPRTIVAWEFRGSTFRAQVVDAARGGVRRTIEKAWLGDVAPGGAHLFAAPSWRIIRLADGREARIEADLADACWRSAETLLGLVGAGESLTLHEIGLDGKTRRRVAIQPTAAGAAWLARHRTSSESRFLDRCPGDPGAVLCGWQRGGSQQGRWAARLKADLRSGKAIPWAETDDIVAAPDGRRFLTSAPRTETDYGHIRVYVRPLYVAQTAAPEDQKAIVDGLVWVNGFDWRPEKGER